MNPEHAAWLAKTTEDILEPEREIVDPHHHLWDFPTDTYRLAELHADTGSGHRVVQTVFVECSAEYRTDGPEHLRPVGEIEFVAAEAAASDASDGATIAGIVGFADLTLGDAVEEVLSAQDHAGAGRFRGIRHANSWHESDAISNAHTHPPEGLLGHADFRRGFAKLGAMGFSFDAWMYHPQVHELADLCAAIPGTPVILDHLGGPLGIAHYAGKREEVRAELRPQLEAVAAHPQVSLKVGGIGMALYGLGWQRNDAPPTSEELANAWRDDVLWAIDTFGPERCMFESNFPVDRRSCSYAILWNTFKRLADAGGYSDDERADLFAGTARRAYRLDPPA